jgi:hypothetical protein
MKPILSMILALALSPAFGADPIVVESGPTRQAVIELYTSEGCSSCPPAERWLKELADMPTDEVNALALAFHVDYWDYIGWKDEFASPAFTKRQNELAERNQQGTVYTPEFFIDGRETRGVYRILQSIRDANATPAPVKLRMQVLQVDQTLQIELRNQFEPGMPYSARFIVFENNLGNMIKRGENSGKFLEHQRVVRYFSEPIQLQPENRHDIRIPSTWKSDNLGVAVVVTRQTDAVAVQSLFTLLSPP